MTRVNVVVEGQTEEAFIQHILGEALWPHRVYLTAILLGVPGHKGGRPSYARLRKDILLHLKQDRTAYCSTMLDFYGLGEGFPGLSSSADLPNAAKAGRIEQAIKADICALAPELRADIRLLPYIQLHEFEGLLFSDPRLFAQAIHQPSLGETFRTVRDGFPCPEDINDGAETAPSKRVLRAFPGYRKVLHGTMAAGQIGVETMRRECPHFRNWLDLLAALPPLR